MALILSGTDGLSDVDGSAATPAIRGTDANTGIFFPAADQVAITTGGTQRVVVDASGNVGIGTSSPAADLHIASAFPEIRLEDNDYAGHYSSIDGNGGSGVLTLNADAGNNVSNSAMRFLVDNTERARITSGGDLLVGTTNTSQSAGVGAKVFSTGNIWIVSPSGDGYSYYNSTASAYRFYVSSGGTISATSTTISAISDVRYKENIRDLDVGLDKIMALKPRLYDWKEGKGADIKNARGFIAQEFEEVFPDLIDEWKDPAPEGEEPYKSVRADLMPVLVKAIQELKALVDGQAVLIATQASTITALQSDVEALKAQP